MDYKEKVIALLKSQELSKEQKEKLEYIFPELKESEDEKIRKAIISFLKSPFVNKNITDEKVTPWLAWLEKQGENPIKWNKNTKDYKPQKNHSVLMKTTHGIAEGEWQGVHWLQYRWSGIIKDSDVIAWMVLPSLERQGEQKCIPKYKIGDYVKNTNYKGEPIYEIVYMDKECYICEYRGKEMMGDKAVMHFSFDNPYLRLVHKPIDKVEPKFKVGDWVFIEEVKGYKNGPFQIKTVDSFGYNFDEYHTIPFMYEELLSKWTIKNAKPGDVLQLGSVTAIFQKYIGNGNCKCYCSVYNGELEIPSQDGTDDSYGCCNAVLATKEQCDTLMKAMTDAGYTFDFEKKELKKIEQKPTQETEPFEAEHGKYYYCIKDYFYGGKKQASKGDVIQALRGLPIMGLKDASEYFLPVNFIKCSSVWSEEDEDVISHLLTICHGAKKFIQFESCTQEDIIKCQDWLTSLKERI